jgi:hypothetical protein
VKVRRRLDRVGALAIKNSVYVLPDRDETAEDFQWLAAGYSVRVARLSSPGRNSFRELPTKKLSRASIRLATNRIAL